MAKIKKVVEPLKIQEVVESNLRKCQDKCVSTGTNICCYDCKLNENCDYKCEHFIYHRMYRLCDNKLLREIKEN